MISCDVLVAGAGPAGAVAASLLARCGLSVILADRPDSGGERIGETLPGAAARLLARLDLPTPGDSPFHRRIGGVISAWGAADEVQDFLNDPDGAGWRLDRPVFDEDLRRAAEAVGARRLQARIRGVARCGAGWRLSTDAGDTLSAAELVDATGRNAGPARRIGARLRRGPRLVAVWATGICATGVVAGDRRSDRTLIEARDDGWWYGAFLPDGRPVAAFHTAPGPAARLRADPAAWRAGLAAATLLSDRMPPALFGTARLHGANAGNAFLQPNHGDGWIACGDAAIALDPLASHGIINALRTGEIVARTLQAADADAAGRAYEQHLAETWRRCTVWREALYRRAGQRLPGGFWHAAVQLPSPAGLNRPSATTGMDEVPSINHIK